MIAKEYLKSKGLNDHDYQDSGMINHISEMMEEYHQSEQLNLCGVGSSFSIGFAEYISKEHYRLVNVIGKIHYWSNEEVNKTSEQLLKEYKESIS